MNNASPANGAGLSDAEAIIAARLRLNTIHCALDGVSAAVKGATIADENQREGILYWLGELSCNLGDVLVQLGAMQGAEATNAR